MVFQYRKVFLGFALGAGCLALFSVPILGWEGTQKFLGVLLLSAGGDWYGMKESAMYNLIGLLTRTVPDLGGETIRLIGWGGYGMMTILLCMLWGRKRDLRIGQIGLTVIVVLFSIPHLHFHDLALLLIPIYELLLWSRQDVQLKTSIASTLPIAISLLFLLSNVSPSLHYLVPYLLMMILAGYPYMSRNQSLPIRPHQS